MPGLDVTAEELWVWILDHTEEIDGQLVCRTPLWGYLEERGIEEPSPRQIMRARLVKELEAQGRVKREYPQSGWLYILDPPTGFRPPPGMRSA